MTPDERLAQMRELEGSETRFIRIMRAILAGDDEEEICARFDVDLQTLGVYAKAVYGDLTYKEELHWHTELCGQALNMVNIEARHERIAGMFENGLRADAIADAMHMRPESVNKIRRDLEARGRLKSKRTDINTRHDEIARMLLDGLTPETVAFRLGMSAETICKLRRSMVVSGRLPADIVKKQRDGRGRFVHPRDRRRV